MMRNAETTRTSEALAGELDALIKSASELLENLNEQRGDAVEGLRSRATRNIENARDRLASLRPEVQERATRAARAATDFARSNPWSTVAIGALVVGAVGALLYASMSDD